MSWFSRLLFGPPASASAVLGAGGLAAGVTPPWGTPADLLPLVYSDIYGPTGVDAVTRETAMTVAPISRGRNVIVSKVSDLPLTLGTIDAEGEFVPDADQPAWLTQTRNPQKPWHRMTLTLDDLLFSGWSLWAIERDDAGRIIDAGRIAQNRWAFDTGSPTGVRVDQKPVTDQTSVVLFAGPHEGLLIVARDSIRGWRYMEAAWVGRVRNPIPLVVLHEKEANGVTQTEAQQYVTAFAGNRTSPTGAYGFLPASLDLEEYGKTDADLFDKGRNAARIDIANHLNLPVTILDGSTSTSSLTYSTQEGTRTQLVDDLELWMAPIESRLSDLDIAGEGKVIRFSRSNLTNVPNDPYGPTATKPTPTAQEASV